MSEFWRKANIVPVITEDATRETEICKYPRRYRANYL